MTSNAVPADFESVLERHRIRLRRGQTRILQLNVGKLCNLTCGHCHVNAGPARKEIIDRPTLDRILEWLDLNPVETVDLTGGAPEMIPDFRYLLEQLRSRHPSLHIIDRCNLTILLEPGFDWVAQLLASLNVEVIASMPCYSPENVNAQRGDGVFDQSIEALRLLNSLGYAQPGSPLKLNLVYNPLGDFLPGNQAQLEQDYKKELLKNFNIRFDHLFTITNMPIARFGAWLRREGRYEGYMDLLRRSFNVGTIDGLMCIDTLSVDWRGRVYDCDFNQMLGLEMGGSEGKKLWEIGDASVTDGGAIRTGDHCFGCTAGSGSSCGGAVI